MSFQDGEWEGKDIFLRKEGENETLGLHSTGMTGDDGQWHSLEAWMNVYVDGKFKASVARIFGPIEQTAEELKQEGWTEYEMPQVQP